MAILKMVAIRDVKTNAFATPIAVRTLAEAERSWSHEINNKAESVVFNHPEDFGLYLIGEYDESTGVLKPEAQPVHVVSALNLKRAQQ